MPIEGSAKVKVGQKVKIKLKNYPYKEYGYIRGIVSEISLTATDDQYYLNININQDLNTNTNFKIDYITNMKGEAEIITEERTLLERLFSKLTSF
ncbi:hypothetical protein E1171_06195 [Cytophagales bacterium RKSG123]|nr:hypothetical protein [Xanthovirga aplysinae]